jgi:Amt family ammonium transporter
MYTVIFSVLAWGIIRATAIGLRVPPEEELRGLDLGEHGMEAYSGFVKE